MPARGDHDARRRDVSTAVWAVLAVQGFGALTLRAVAAEMGVSTGLLTHYFPSKQALIAHAVDVAEERTATRSRSGPGLRERLLDVLPLTTEMVAMSRVWISFWAAALGDPDLAAAQTARYVRWRERLRDEVQAAGLVGDPDDLAARCAAFAHGLVVQAVFDPERFPAGRQIQLLDEFLGSLRRGSA